MSERNSMLPEITGLAAGIIVGAMVMVIGRFLFNNGIVPTYTNNWIENNYDPAAFVVWVVSAIFAIIWYFVSLKWWRTFTAKESGQAFFLWLLLFALPILSCVISLFIWGKDGNNSLEALAFFVLILILSIGMFFGYWLSTALSTPSNMCHIIPLTRLFRR